MRVACIVVGWLMAAAIVWLSLTPSPPSLGFKMSDKIEHFLGYGSLMFWFCQLYAGRNARIGYGALWTAMGIGLEFAQGALGYRLFEVFDMLANTLGVLIGWALSLLSPRFLPPK